MGDQNEGTKVVNIVIAILVFMVVAAAMIGFVMWGANKFNEAQSDLTDTVNGMDVSKYNAYDAKTVSGADLISAAKTYRDMEMAIFVSTKKMNGGSPYDPATAPDALATGTGCQGFGYHMEGNPAPTYDADNGRWLMDPSISDPDLKNNGNFAPLTTKGNDAYINQAAKFYAELVWDVDTEEVTGILFRQVEKN